MDLINSQESEIINEGEMNYIMKELGPSDQLLFLHGNEEYVDIYNPTHQQHLNNVLLQQHEIKSEHQLQQHHLSEQQQLTEEQQHFDNNLQQHLHEQKHLQEQHLNNALQQHQLADSNNLHQQHLNEQQQNLNNGLQQHQLADSIHLQQQHLNDQQHLAEGQHLQEQQQQHFNEFPQQQTVHDHVQLQQQNLTNQGEGAGGEILPPPPAPPPTPQQHTSPTGVQPCLDNYPGDYDFEVSLANSHGRHAWVYSSKLQKIYIDMDKVLMLQFRLNTVDVKGLCVRALLVYSDPDHVMQAVKRCTLHLFKCDPNRLAHPNAHTCNCAAYRQCGHVVTSDHPGARYEFAPTSGRHSVLVPLGGGSHAPGQEAAAVVAYQFGCKTSCTAGMSRRPVQMVFTLESHFGDVLGRSKLAVKICSCPKRDRDREESGEVTELHHVHTKLQPYAPPQTQPPATKKRKLHHHHHINSGDSKVLINNDAVNKDANHLPDIAILFEEVRKLNEKVEQMNTRIEEVFSVLKEIASSLRNGGNNNCRPNQNNGYPYDPDY